MLLGHNDGAHPLRPFHFTRESHHEDAESKAARKQGVAIVSVPLASRAHRLSPSGRSSLLVPEAAIAMARPHANAPACSCDAAACLARR